MKQSRILFFLALMMSFSTDILSQDRDSSILKASSTGKILDTRNNSGDQGIRSANAIYRCTYDIGNVTDEIRELKNVKFYMNYDLLFTMDTAPGSDLYISNTGYIAKGHPDSPCLAARICSNNLEM